MHNDLRLRFQKGDLLACALVLLIAAAVFFAFLPGSSGMQNASVEIYLNGERIGSYPLDRDFEAEIAGDYTNTVTIQDGQAAITQSDCPGGDCMHSGWISASGRSIVCLPNRAEVRIVGAVDEVDFTVG